jgi:class 3 adenylate cyclase/DNA polymerase III delta prime subunit
MAESGGRIETLSVLFTDLVGSTEQRVRSGEDAADVLRRAHDALLAQVIAGHGGTVVKGLGDGVMATFASAAEAVAAAVGIQQAADAHARREPTLGFTLRVGVSTGDVSIEDGDAFGVPVVEASRLCSAAGPGEVLAAELVRALARGRGGFVFEPMGELELKGLADPVPACRVLWEPLLIDEAAEEPVVPLPPALSGALATAYVGRDELRERLAATWAITRSGSCRTVLLAGEPGVGKTRTAAELARSAFAEGGVVLFGRCDEELGVPYQPFVEALEHYVAHADVAELGRFAGELRRLVPDLGQSVDVSLQPVASDPASEEHRLFEAAAGWLCAAATAAGGCVLVVDDVHWATKPTLQLLQHIVRSAADAHAPLLVVATYRDTDIDRSHPLSAAIGDLRRLPGVERLPVDNLDAGEVIDLIAAAAGHELDEPTQRLAEAVFAETDGNPFFVGEVLRHLVETGGVRREGERWTVADPEHVDVPEGVRDVVGRRLNRLSDTANQVLSMAAVLGRDFDAEVLIALGDASEDTVLDALDEAVRARLAEEVGVDRFRFAHALVRTTLYDELSATRRRRLHHRVADVLEKVRPHDVRALAHHCTLGGPDGGDVSRALGYTVAAAAEAQAARAFAEGEELYRAALELLEDADEERSIRWVAARCGLGECLRDQGDPGFREVLLEAARRALELDDVDLAIRAALANTRGWASIVGGIDDDRIEVIEEVLARAGDADAAVRAGIVALLASELTFSPDPHRRTGLVDEAIELARQVADQRLLAQVLVRTGFPSLTGARAELVGRNATEGVQLSDEVGDPTLRALARVFWGGTAMTLGDVGASLAAAEELAAISASEGTPFIRWISAANAIRPAVLAGDLATAAARNAEALALGQALGQPDAEAWWASTEAGLANLRGTVGELADLIGDFSEQFPGAAWHGAHAWALAEGGRLAEARAAVQRYGLDAVRLVDEVFPFVSTLQMGIVAGRLDDPELGARAVEAIEPHRGRWAHYFLYVLGPMTWPLGVARAATGDLDGAVSELEATTEVLERVGMRAHLNVARVDLLRVLRRRNLGPDRDRVAQLDAEIREGASAIAADGVVVQLDAALS